MEERSQVLVSTAYMWVNLTLPDAVNSSLEFFLERHYQGEQDSSEEESISTVNKALHRN